jgi:hypothetical protein
VKNRQVGRPVIELNINITMFCRQNVIVLARIFVSCYPKGCICFYESDFVESGQGINDKENSDDCTSKWLNRRDSDVDQQELAVVTKILGTREWVSRLAKNEMGTTNQ